GETLRFGSGIYRFRPDGSKMEFLYQFNNNTWGLGFNGAGDVFGSTANRNPAFFGGFPQTGYIDRKPGASARMIADEISFYPITPRIRQVDAFGQYTAGAGYALATSANFPPSWRNRMAFIGGPTGHLLGLFDHTREGAGFRASNQYHFLASTDEWFSPVAAEVGPDGNLWVADWYNFIIQHNPVPTVERGGYDTINGPGNAHVNPLRDKQHGRIYRAIWDGAKPSSITSLEGATDEELLAALSHDNQFWRLTAQRILVAGERHDLDPQLKALLANTKGIPAAHALWTLDGLGELDRETHQTALLRGQDPVLKRNAIRAIPNTDDGMQLFFDTAVVQSPDSLVRLAAFSKLAHFPNRKRVEETAKRLIRRKENQSDEWLALALRAGGAGKVGRGPGKTIGPNLLPNSSFEEVSDGLPLGWTIRTYSGAAEHLVATGEARSGENSLRIASDDGGDSSVFATIAVEPKTDYRLVGWVKTSGLMGGRGAQMNAHEVQDQPRGSRTN
ncbi:MAG: glycosyl hydrolase, partial [Verrucomicrobiota bacterium]